MAIPREERARARRVRGTRHGMGMAGRGRRVEARGRPGRERVAIARQRDGRRNAVGPGACAVCRERRGQAGHGARDRDGVIAHVVEKIAQMIAVAVAILFDDDIVPHVVRHA